MGTLILHDEFAFDVGEVDEHDEDDEDDDEDDEDVEDFDEGVLFKVEPDTSKLLLSDRVSLAVKLEESVAELDSLKLFDDLVRVDRRFPIMGVTTKECKLIFQET